MTAPILELTRADLARGGRRVLTDVSLRVGAGEVVGLVGANGAGKTTLLRAILGLEPALCGGVRLAGREVSALGPQAIAGLAAYMPQDRRLAWNLAAWRVVSLAWPTLSPERNRLKAFEALRRVGLPDLAERGVQDLSGGEVARVLLARLLAAGRPLLVADEPAAGLDPDAGFTVMQALAAAAREGAAVIVTLHDLTLAARYCSRIVVLAEGGVAADAAPEQALTADSLRRAFGVEGRLIETDLGPIVNLAARIRAD